MRMVFTIVIVLAFFFGAEAQNKTSRYLAGSIEMYNKSDYKLLLRNSNPDLYITLTLNSKSKGTMKLSTGPVFKIKSLLKRKGNYTVYSAVSNLNVSCEIHIKDFPAYLDMLIVDDTNIIKYLLFPASQE